MQIFLIPKGQDKTLREENEKLVGLSRTIVSLSKDLNEANSILYDSTWIDILIKIDSYEEAKVHSHNKHFLLLDMWKLSSSVMGDIN